MPTPVGYHTHGRQNPARNDGMRPSLSSGDSRHRQQLYDPPQELQTTRLEKEVSQQFRGEAYTTTNNNYASATTIQHASHITVVSQRANDDLFLLETLPRHPDVSGEWTEFGQNSRGNEISEIWDWVDSRKQKDLILWIHGASGLGKSKLARKLREEARLLDRLAAAVFLSRLPAETWGPETLIRLIAGEIGRTHRKAVPVIAEAVRQCHAAPLRSQVERFIRDPLLALQLPYPLIVIIDAIQERRSHTRFIEQLAYLKLYSSLIRFVVLGRSEPSQNLFRSVPIRSYALDAVSVTVMAEYLATRFETIGWEEGMRPTPEDALRLAALANGLFFRMEVVVSIFQNIPPSIRNHDGLSKHIFDYARSTYGCLEASNSAEELDHSILLDRVAMALRPLGHLSRHDSLFFLAVSLHNRFNVAGSMKDLDEAILLFRECLPLQPLDHKNRGYALNNLASALRRRFLKARSATDLEEAIRLHREALVFWPPGRKDRHHSCHNLALVLHDRYKRDGLVGDLDEAIYLAREAVSLRPQRHRHRFETVNSLRIYVNDRFEAKGAVEDIREAISLAEEAISICPKDSPHHTILPGKLGYYRAELGRMLALSSRV